MELFIVDPEEELALVLVAAAVVTGVGVADRILAVVMGFPSSSVVAAGIVVICAAATVMFFIPTRLAVFAHRQYGTSVGTKSPVVDNPTKALV